MEIVLYMFFKKKFNNLNSFQWLKSQPYQGHFYLLLVTKYFSQRQYISNIFQNFAMNNAVE
jgi:hypothetical protein